MMLTSLHLRQKSKEVCIKIFELFMGANETVHNIQVSLERGSYFHLSTKTIPQSLTCTSLLTVSGVGNCKRCQCNSRLSVKYSYDHCQP